MLIPFADGSNRTVVGLEGDYVHASILEGSP